MYQPYPGSAQIAAPVKIFALVVWLVGLAAVVFLWRGTSRDTGHHDYGYGYGYGYG
ncbi:MAG TPA: hypothetical protein VIV12_16405 [Streptosporangiaceae bacterium]